MPSRRVACAWIAMAVAVVAMFASLRRERVHASTERVQQQRPRASSAGLRAPGVARSGPASRDVPEPPPEASERQPAAESELSGSVVDVAGGVVPFALVTARAVVDGSRAVVTADAQGEFRVPVQPGGQLLSARSEAFSGVLRRVQAPRSGIVLELGPSSEMSGRVVDAQSGAPLASVVVTVTALSDGVTGTGPAREAPVRALSNAAGDFAVGGLRGGRAYRVSVTGEAWRSEPETILLEVGVRSTPVLLAAAPAAVLSGRVLRDGEPCAAGSARLAGAREERFESIGSDGRVRFAGLEPGIHALEVFCDGALPLRQELELAAATVAREWHVDAGLSVRGHVVGASGLSLSGARISVLPLVEAGEQRPSSSCSSGERGEFSCSGLEPGVHEVSVADPLDPGAERAAVDLGAGATPDVVLHVRPLASIRAAIAGSELYGSRSWRVFARGPSAFPIEARRGAAGFELERLPLGLYEVYVDAPSPDGISHVELTSDGQVREIELRAPPPAPISGVALDDSGAPLVDVWVSASASDPLARSPHDSDPEVLTDESGGFTLPAVRGGVYDLSASSAAGSARITSVTAGATDVVLRVAARDQRTFEGRYE